MEKKRKMKVSCRWFLLVFIFTVIFSGISSYSTSDTISVRSEGGSSITAGNAASAKEAAVQNALRKAVRSQVNELVSLSKAESEKLLPLIEGSADNYVAKYDVVEEGTINDVIRIILDIELSKNTTKNVVI